MVKRVRQVLKYSIRSLVVLVILSAGMGMTSDTTIRQQGQRWTPPRLLFDPVVYSVGDVVNHGYSITADPSGGLHVFLSYSALDQQGNPLPVFPYNAILYIHGDGNKWSAPTEIIVNEQPERWQGAYVTSGADKQGNLYVLLSHGPLQLYSARVADAADVHAWRSVTGGDWGQRVANAAMAFDVAGGLHLVYSLLPGDVYYRYSPDGGATWSADIAVSQVENISTSDDVAIAVDSSNRVHVVWSENRSPEGYPPIGIFYSYSDDGRSWIAPIQIGDQYGTRPALAVRDPNEVDVVWSTSVQDRGRYAATSIDNGSTWTRPQLVLRQNTGQVPYSEHLLTDSSGTLHWILSDDSGDYYLTRKTGESWSEPEKMSFPVSAHWTRSKSAYGTSAVIVQGNELRLLAREGTQSEGFPFRFWITELQLDAPAKQITALPTVTPTSAIGVQTRLAPTAHRVSTPMAVNQTLPSSNPGATGDVIVAAILPLLVLVSAVAGLRLLRRSRS